MDEKEIDRLKNEFIGAFTVAWQKVGSGDIPQYCSLPSEFGSFDGVYVRIFEDKSIFFGELNIYFLIGKKFAQEASLTLILKNPHSEYECLVKEGCHVLVWRLFNGIKCHVLDKAKQIELDIGRALAYIEKSAKE